MLSPPSSNASRARLASAFAFLLLAVPAAQAQETPALEAHEEKMHAAFANGDARALLAQAAGRVEVDLPGGSSQYSRSQAVYVLQQFFDTYPPRRFVWQRRSLQGQSRFLMGRYWHEASDEPMAVYLHFAKGEGAWRLREVRAKQP